MPLQVISQYPNTEKKSIYCKKGGNNAKRIDT